MKLIFRLLALVSLTVVALACADDGDTGSAETSGASEVTRPADLRLELPDAFTPVVGSIVGPETAPVLGTDGQEHVVYEVWLTNAKQVPATVETIEVLDFDDQSEVLATYDGPDLVATQLSVRPRGLEPDTGALVPDDRVLQPNESMLAFIELAFEPGESPDRIVHRLVGQGATNPGSTEPDDIEYLLMPWDISERTAPVIGPPLEGSGWAAVNGCCDHTGAHRDAVQTVNGTLVDSQRFAIDWMQIGDNGAFFDGDPADPTNWYNYGEPVLAVADGTVVEVLDGLPDQAPGTLPDPRTLSLETVDGNHVILDLGGGVFAFYAHLSEGTVAVEEGDEVNAGDVLGELGNSGNTSAPHLHLHLMAGPSALAADGLPMSFDAFTLEGTIDREQWLDGSDLLDDVWQIDTADTGDVEAQLPLDLSVVDFGDRD